MADDGWDLQAVVRGCCGATATAAAPDPFCSFSPLGLPEVGWGDQDDLGFCFPELFGVQTEVQDLDELWKAFVADSPRQQSQRQQQPQQQQLLSPQGSSSSCSVVPQVPAAALAPLPQPLARQPPQRTPPHTPRPKRRKNQQKRVVCQVPADGLSADMWAWRKYGQKPIKGSPYPRGYYRCSSSKGCLARKQVERSRNDPGMFVITYTGEHNHPQPTHRNSLAGSTRQKFPSSSSPAASPASGAALVRPEHPDCKASPCSPLSSPSAAGLSPVTPLTDSMEEEAHLRRGIGGEGQGAEEEVDEGDLLLVGDMEMLGEDDVLFLGLEEMGSKPDAAFGDAFSDHFGAFPAPWMANNTAAAAGGR
ncbi:hypothetical protein Taro_030812 [Colocasia esculenta]|uniref:WRKY domain-containing protein n=1 Tax=Colocasia esculenta TaxID=4460 RepID=A0A843VX74_COLES|nr:hypothetical protein [Colocasia esculenta]